MKRLLTSLTVGLMVFVLMLSTVTLMISAITRETIFSVDWFQRAFSRPEYLAGLRVAIEDDLAEQGAYVGIPATVLEKGLDDDQLYIILRKHMETATDALNGRADFVLPEYPAARFSEPLMAYANELNQQGGLTLSADQEKLLQEIARDSALIVQKRVGILDLSTVAKSSTFQSVHQLLFRVSHLSGLAGWVMAAALLLLLLLNFNRLRRFLRSVMIGYWLAGAVIGVPLLVQEVFGLARRISVSPDYFKFAVDQLLTSATRTLLLWSLSVLILSSIVLVIFFLVEHHLAEKGRQAERRQSRRQKRTEKAIL